MESANGNGLASSLMRDLQESAEPIRQSCRAIDARITELESELNELREIRRTAHKMLAIADPSSVPASKKSAKTNPGNVGAHERTLKRKDEIRKWAREHAHEFPEGFTAADVDAALELGVKVGSINLYLASLADESFLRLDHLGGKRATQKFFKLAAPAAVVAA